MFSNDLYFGIILTVVVFGILFLFISPMKKLKNKTEKQLLWQFYINKLVWVFFICLSIYYAFTIPYVGNFYQSKGNLPRPNSSVQNIDTKAYLLDYQDRIEDLEKELSETKVELRELRENYKGVYFVVLMGVIMFGGIQIFGTSKQEWMNKHKKDTKQES
jgi:hypothetical protein